MGIFSNSNDYMRRAEEDAYWRAHLEGLAKKAEPGVRVMADDLMREFENEHERQVAGWRFECRRYGDFLTVFVERDGGKDKKKIKHSTSLNIASTNEIRMVPGHAPDRHGYVSFRAICRQEGDSGDMWGTGMGRCAPPNGYHYEVRPEMPHIPVRYCVTETHDNSNGHFYSNGCDYHPMYCVVDYPRPAEDDTIVFGRIGKFILTPAGMGASVLQTVLDEIRRGYEPPVGVATTAAAYP